MTIDSSKIFRNHFANLLKHPEAIQNPDQIWETLNETFEALGSHRPELNIEGRQIAVAYLKGQDLQIFAKFAKSFVHTAQFSEEQAEKMQAHLSAIKGDGSFSHDLRRLATVERELALRVPLEPEGRGEGIAVEAHNHVVRTLRTMQESARDLDKKVSQLKRRDKIHKRVGIGLLVGGAVAFFALVVPLAIFAPFLAPIAPVAALPFLLGIFFASGVFGQIHGTKQPVEAKLQANLNQFIAHEKYKKYVAEPEFEQFAADPDNGYERLKADDTTFFKFITLYTWQKEYAKDLRIAEEALKKVDHAKPVQAAMELNTTQQQIRELNSAFTRINQLRESLQLQPLPKPEI